MNAVEFRRSAERVGRMRELLNDPTLAEAIVCLRDDRPIEDAIDHADPVMSVRLLSRYFGYHDAIFALLRLAEPEEPTPAEPPENFGVNLSEFQTTTP